MSIFMVVYVPSYWSAAVMLQSVVIMLSRAYGTGGSNCVCMDLRFEQWHEITGRGGWYHRCERR